MTAFKQVPGLYDLATPHEVQRPPEQDVTVRAIAAVLVAGSALAVQQKMIHGLLKPYGVGLDAVKLAMQLAERGTVTRPNAKLAAVGATREMLSGVQLGDVYAARNREMYFRASYVAHAAKRIQLELEGGKSSTEAVQGELRYFRAHEEARHSRLTTATQVQVAAQFYGWDEPEGTLVGWYLNPFLNNEEECISANGSNFYAEKGTVIGLPGSVHANCGCYAGPPHVGAEMVDDAVKKVIKLAPRRRPTFKLKTGSRRAV